MSTPTPTGPNSYPDPTSYPQAPVAVGPYTPGARLPAAPSDYCDYSPAGNGPITTFPPATSQLPDRLLRTGNVRTRVIAAYEAGSAVVARLVDTSQRVYSALYSRSERVVDAIANSSGADRFRAAVRHTGPVQQAFNNLFDRWDETEPWLGPRIQNLARFIGSRAVGARQIFVRLMPQEPMRAAVHTLINDWVAHGSGAIIPYPTNPPSSTHLRPTLPLRGDDGWSAMPTGAPLRNNLTDRFEDTIPYPANGKTNAPHPAYPSDGGDGRSDAPAEAQTLADADADFERRMVEATAYIDKYYPLEPNATAAEQSERNQKIRGYAILLGHSEAQRSRVVDQASAAARRQAAYAATETDLAQGVDKRIRTINAAEYDPLIMELKRSRALREQSIYDGIQGALHADPNGAVYTSNTLDRAALFVNAIADSRSEELRMLRAFITDNPRLEDGVTIALASAMHKLRLISDQDRSAFAEAAVRILSESAARAARA